VTVHPSTASVPTSYYSMRHYTPTVYITVQSWCRVSVDLLLMSATVVHWFASVVIIRSCDFTSSVNYILSVCRHVVYVIRFCAVRSIAGVNRVSAPWCRVSLCAGIVSAYLFIGYAVWRRYRFARRTVGMSIRINYHVSPHDRRRARVKCVVGQLSQLSKIYFFVPQSVS